MSRALRLTRNVQSNTGYYLIVDLSTHTSLSSVTRIIDAVSEVLAVGCSSRGIQRISYFGLALINIHFDIIWKLSRLRGNYSKILKAFDLLKKVSTTSSLSEEEFFDFLHMGVQQMSPQINQLLQQEGRCEEVELKVVVVVATTRDGYPLKFYLSSLAQRLLLPKHTTFQIIEISDNVLENTVNDGIIRLDQVRDEAVELSRVVKEWLADVRFDREDLLLKISDEELKCDIYEMLIDTSQLPFHNAFHLHKEISNASYSSLPDPVMPVYRLVAVQRICSSGISEGSVFGYPLQLRATSNISHPNTLLSNAQRFEAVCKTLYDADEYLIAKLCEDNSPSGYFVLMPGEGKLLVKSVGCRELVLPTVSVRLGLCDQGPGELDYEDRLRANNLLYSLPLSEEFDPLHFSSGLNTSLSHLLLSKKSTEKGELEVSRSPPKCSVEMSRRKRFLPQKSSSAKKTQPPVNSLKLVNHLASLH